MKDEIRKVYEELTLLRNSLMSFKKRSDAKHRRSLKERRELRKAIVDLRYANESVLIQNIKLVREKERCQQKQKMK